MLEPIIRPIIEGIIEPIIGTNVPPFDQWILATSFWDDTGIWIDTETWND